MPKGTAINNQRPRLPLPRQIGGAPIPFPKGGIFFFPFEQAEAEPKASWEDEGSSLLGILFLLMLLVVAGIYLFGGNPTITPNNLAPPINATNTRRVEAYDLNLRDMPSEDSPVKSILLQGTQVEVLNETQQEFDGDIWVKVRVQTQEGLQDGWVNARYLR